MFIEKVKNNFEKFKFPLTIKLSLKFLGLYLCFLIFFALIKNSLPSMNSQVIIYIPLLLSHLVTIGVYTLKFAEKLTLSFKVNYVFLSSILLIVLFAFFGKINFWFFFLFYVVSYFLVDTTNKTILIRLNLKESFKDRISKY